LHCEESFSHHALDRPQKEWHPNGQIRKEAHYKKDLLEGKCQEWYETGVPRLQSFYAQNRLEGEYWEWYGNGHMRKQFSYAGGIRLERNTSPYKHAEQSTRALSSRKPLFEAGFIAGSGYALASAGAVPQKIHLISSLISTYLLDKRLTTNFL
jgi:hypothetical protein